MVFFDTFNKCSFITFFFCLSLLLYLFNLCFDRLNLHMVGELGHHPLIVIAVTVMAAVEVCQGTLTIEVDIVIYAISNALAVFWQNQSVFT